MCVLEKERYSLEEVADELHRKVNKLLHYAEIGKLEICIYVEERESYVAPQLKKYQSSLTKLEGFKLDHKIEHFPGGPCPVLLSPKDWRKLQERDLHVGDDNPLSYVVLKHPQKEGYLHPDRYTYDFSRLIITHEEKVRFKAVYELASNTKATTHSKPTRRININELHEVIWDIYLALANKHSHEPTSGEVWFELNRELGRVLRVYDKEEIIQEITEGTIHWIDSDGGKHTLTKGSFKTILSRIKKDRKK